jgi:hypothetical protein
MASHLRAAPFPAQCQCREYHGLGTLLPGGEAHALLTAKGHTHERETGGERHREKERGPQREGRGEDGEFGTEGNLLTSGPFRITTWTHAYPRKMRVQLRHMGGESYSAP